MNKQNLLYSSQSYFLGDQFVTEHTPSVPLRGVFVLLHGFPAWVTKNYDVGEVLAQLGYKVFIPHHRGLGQSKGTFLFSENIKTTRELLQQIKETHPTLGLSLVGHSWGGYLSLRHLDLGIDRMILLAPLARFPKDDRRLTLVSNLYHSNINDLTHYSLASLEAEFDYLEKNLDYEILNDPHLSPKSLLIYGSKDEVIPADLMQDFGNDAASNRFETVVLNDDHRLSKRRPVLEKIRSWILTN